MASSRRCADCYHWRREGKASEAGTCHQSKPALGKHPWPVTHEDERCPGFVSVAYAPPSGVGLTTRTGPS